MTSWHVATAAEAVAAAQFARYGFDVLVQYGANLPEYDLSITRAEHSLKVSVKGSQDGGWGLTQSYLSREVRADYHGAADRWLARHKPRTAMCLVQFQGVSDDLLPRMYFAWPADVAALLRAASKGRGDTILWEDHMHGARAFGTGTRDALPEEWRMTRERVEALITA